MITKPTTYTAEFCLAEAQSLLAAVIANPTVVYIGELIEPKPYTHSRVNEWERTYAETCPEIPLTLRKVKEICGGRLYKGGLESRFNARLTEFGLKNNHGWRDESDVNVGGKEGAPAVKLNVIIEK